MPGHQYQIYWGVGSFDVFTYTSLRRYDMSDRCSKQNGRPKIALNFSVVFFLRDWFSVEKSTSNTSIT